MEYHHPENDSKNGDHKQEDDDRRKDLLKKGERLSIKECGDRDRPEKRLRLTDKEHPE